MHEEFNYSIENEKEIIRITSNSGGNSCNRVLYLSYENALWLINKLRPMTFDELTNNKKFDTKKEIIEFNNNVLFFDYSFVERGNSWFNISIVYDNDDTKYGSMTLPFSVIEQYEDKFYFKEFVYPFLNDLEKHLPEEYRKKVIR